MSRKDQSAAANVFSLYKQKGSRFYSMRLMHKGKRRRFSTGHTSIKDAKAKAKAIMADIQSRGFEEATRIHSKRRDQIPLNPTIEEFTELYRTVCSEFDRPPSRATRERYIRSLERIAESTGVRRIASLDERKVDEFKRRYLANGRKAKRVDQSIRITLNGILRNAASLFSTQALQSFRRKGLELENPFRGAQIRGIKIKPYSPLPREIVETIWKDSAKLRDGDPDADPPPEEVRPRDAIDFRQPHRDSYALLLLELGLGLRRNEADKARWDWFSKDGAGRRFIEVREDPHFRPKSGESRVIPVDNALWEALVEVKENEEFVVDGHAPEELRPEKDKKSATYRCDQAHRVFVAWLRKMGVDDPKPCHRLRKEFGSFVSTTFGLFYAQRFLGHSSPSVTSAYYAGLTDFPQLKAMPDTKPDAEKQKSPNIQNDD
ncbi:MAG: tyrosine-type recombinase/integrase [Verrucomicrobiales bacterium]